MDKAMTKRRLEQYRTLQEEIAMLEARILAAENSGEYVTDAVRGSSQDIPYQQQTVVIEGYGSSKVPRLLAQKRELVAACETVELYIESIGDSKMRQILTWRYILGKTVEETAQLVGYSESQVKRRVDKLFLKDAL